MIDAVLEAEFALRARHPERGAVYDGYRRRSAAFRAAQPAMLDIRYAPGPRCCLDVFSAGDGAPVFLFIHGGYWRALDRQDFSFLAASYQRAGMSVVMPSYDLAPAVTVTEILAQMRAALAWVVAVLEPSRLIVGGHSAGGQLAAMLGIEQAERGAFGPIEMVVGVSGAFDLVPLLRTSVNDDVGMTEEEAVAMSPLRRVAGLSGLVPLRALVGGAETEGFKSWSRDLAQAWPGTVVHEVSGLTHFTILEHIAMQPRDVLGAALNS